MIKMFRHVVATAACAPGGGWGGCLFAGHSDQSCLAPYYPSSLLRWLHVNSHQLADPRQDGSKILLIFWFLKFAPFTSNHCQYRCVSRCLFSFTPRCTQLIPHVHQFIFSIEQLNYWGPLYESGRLHLGVSYSFGRESFWGGAGGWLCMNSAKRQGQGWTEYLEVPDIVELSIAGRL